MRLPMSSLSLNKNFVLEDSCILKNICLYKFLTVTTSLKYFIVVFTTVKPFILFILKYSSKEIVFLLK